MMKLFRLIRLHEFFTFKALYFLMYSGFGILSPYAPVYYELMKLSKSQIGILSMMPNICSFLVAPLFSALSDMLNAHYEIMVFCMITSTVAMTATLMCSSFGSFVLVTLISSILRAPVSPNVDALVIASLSDKTRYGEMRLWGAISFGIFSLVGGLMTSTGNNPVALLSTSQQEIQRQSEITAFQYIYLLHALFFISSGFIVLYIVYQIMKGRDLLPKIRFHAQQRSISLINLDEESIKVIVAGMPISFINSLDIKDNSTIIISNSTASLEDNISKTGKEVNNSKEDRKIQKVGLVNAFLQVFADHPSVGIFALVVFLSGFGSGVIDAFLFLRLRQLGGTGLVMGISRFITCASEVPMFQIAGHLHQKYGTWAMLTMTQFAFVVRFTYYSLLTIPWAILPCEVLHGLTFAVTWSVSCTFANMISPPECHTTMQALLEGLHWGFGSGMGALVGGYLYDSIGAVRLFQVSGFLSLLSMFLAIFAWITVGRRDDTFGNQHHSPTTEKATGDEDTILSGIHLTSISGNKKSNNTHGNGQILYSSLSQNLQEVDDETVYV